MRKICACFLLLALLLPACSRERPQPSSPSAPSPSPASAVTFTDDLGRELTVNPPRRVAALIGSFADVWLLAGGEDSLVAAAGDAWTSLGLDLGEKTINLGSVAAPNLELLLDARPDLVLASCNTQANLDLLDAFEDAGIPAAYFEVDNFGDYLRMLEICARLTGCEDRYDAYGLQVRNQVDAAVARQDGSAPTVLYIRASGSSCKVKGGQGSVLGEMLSALGCVNVADRDGALLESLSLEGIIAADPDYMFAVLQGTDKDKAQAVLEATLLSNPAWNGLRAVEEGRFYTMDPTLYNLKPNARWGEAYETLADILYPAG